ncbi:MAG: hypothetical protein LBJ72_06785 [Dysgonamonadaceae bacterium]|jgi:hypothetical protein|nr:hypothetical protein [Dysgonamonadaceae bacterium]
MKIKYFKHYDIDKKAYDDCILRSSQGTVYAMSWYLDTVSPGWELLATENFEAVMPVPVKQKFGIKYCISPHLCQQLGLFSSSFSDENTVKDFIRHIPYSNYRIQLNSGNLWGNPFKDRNVLLRQNYLLNLEQTYTDIRKNYKKNCQRNLKKAQTEDMQIFRDTPQKEYIDFLKENSANRPVKDLIPLLKQLLESTGKHTKTEIRSVRDHSGNILSCTFFLYWKNRVYYMTPGSSPEGKKTQSMSFLIDQFIQIHASSGLILDFEGSSIPNIARFYEGFGATCEHYPLIVKKNIPAKIYSLLARTGR